MRKFFKGILLTSLVSLSTTAVVVPLGIYHQQQTISQPVNNVQGSSVNYDLVAKFLNQDNPPKSKLQAAANSLSAPVTNGTESDIVPNNSVSLTSDQEAFVKQKQVELLALFKARNYTTAQINDYLVTNIPGYADEYNKASQALPVSATTTNDTKHAGNQAFTFVLQDASSTVTNDNLTETINGLTTARDVFVGLSIAAGLTAAGLLILAPFTGGATAAAGSACAIASAVLGGFGSALDLALITYKEKTNALTAASALFDTYTLGHLLREIVKPIIEKVLKVTASFSWAFPAILILEATISTILVLLDHFA